MSEAMRMWMEITFNIAYLIVIWGLVILMYFRRNYVEAPDQRVADLVMKAFALLAIGDTGHVGFRVIAYVMGDLQATISILGVEMGFVGLGALTTAITVTFFYMLILMVWHARYQKPYGWFGYSLFAAGVIRLIIMVFPANEWNNLVPPQPWSLIRNIPLMIQGFGVTYLILRDAKEKNDRPFIWTGVAILISYAMYVPVILFVQQIPLIGMLMIPKTMAYVAIAFIAYNAFYRNPEPALADVKIGD
jgi:hypothetical protein